MRVGARTNAALFILVAAAFLTGWLAFAYGTVPARWSLVVHATSGVAILILLPWKSMIARRALDRPKPRPGRWVSIVLAALVLVSLAAGLAHSTGVWLWTGWLTAMDVHVGAALVAVPLAAWHVIARPVRLRPADVSRRTFLRAAGVMAVAGAVYGSTELVVRAAGLPGKQRRFTGSYEAGSFDPPAMPVSSWMFDAIPEIDASSWTLRVGVRELTYAELLAFDDRITCTLDCTGGFYSTQEWSGVRLDRLLGATRGASVRVASRTGYDRRFPIEEAGKLLLATRFGGQPLNSDHGFPARLVAPDRRGFWWVKWVVAIEVDDLPYWFQSPYPLQ
ncbi:MAG TPA: molybdopterin-dependent oxidoreductase [Candidatus Dormibacteraeota bacterium]|nr:molybdopterin-dependent oxidoreductase [Candidatus Dormibacteraeota bacterium]